MPRSCEGETPATATAAMNLKPTTSEERKQARAHRDAATKNRIDQHLANAHAAAQRGDVVNEEHDIAKAIDAGKATDSRLVRRRWAMYAHDQIKDLRGRQKVRPAKRLGEIGPIVAYEDRLVLDGRTCPLTHDVSARVGYEGDIHFQSRPTLTRMAALSILPGSALLPVLALPKTERIDGRRFYFVVEHPGWTWAIWISQRHQTQYAELAKEINNAASAKRPEEHGDGAAGHPPANAGAPAVA